MFVIVLGVGLVLTVLAYLIRTPILSLVFGLPLNQHSTTLAILVFLEFCILLGLFLGMS